MQAAQKNILKLYIIAACTGVVFYYAIDKIFMQLRGLSLTEMVIIEVIYGIVVVLAEVPSGALSDRWSRKYILALNSLFFLLNTVFWAVSHSFLLFAIGVIFGALHTTFQSGTNTSLLYDSLKEIGKEQQYGKYLGKTRAVSAAALIFAAMVGGWIGQTFGLEATFWWTLPFIVIGAIVTLMLHEPRFHRSTGEVAYWVHIKETYFYLIKKPRLVHLAGVLIATTIPMLLFDEYGQVYFSFVGVSVIGLGLLAALSSSLDALMNTVAYKLARFRHDVLFTLCLVVMGAGFIIAGFLHNMLGVALLFIGSVMFFVVAIIAETDLHNHLTSSIRATSESFFSLAEKLLYIPVALAFAWIGQNYSIATAFSWTGVLIAMYLLLFAIFSRKHIRHVGTT